MLNLKLTVDIRRNVELKAISVSRIQSYKVLMYQPCTKTILCDLRPPFRSELMVRIFILIFFYSSSTHKIKSNKNTESIIQPYCTKINNIFWEGSAGFPSKLQTACWCCTNTNIVIQCTKICEYQGVVHISRNQGGGGGFPNDYVRLRGGFWPMIT